MKYYSRGRQMMLKAWTEKGFEIFIEKLKKHFCILLKQKDFVDSFWFEINFAHQFQIDERKIF